MTEYRFFFHYNKPAKKMTVHFRGQCHIAKNLKIYPGVETHYNVRQPYLVMRGMATGLFVDPLTDSITVQNLNEKTVRT